MDKDVFIKSDIGAQAAWKGFSSQTLYIAYRLVTDIQGYEYYPEDIEDLVVKYNGEVIEAVQVKNITAALTISHLSSTKTSKGGEGFFKRMCSLHSKYSNFKTIKVVYFGDLGVELQDLEKGVEKTKENIREKLVDNHGLLDDEAEWLLNSLKFEKVEEKQLTDGIHQQIKSYMPIMAAPYLAKSLLVQYISKLSKEKGYTCLKSWEEEIHKIGTSIAGIDGYFKEYDKSLIRLSELTMDKDYIELKDEFLQGVSVHPMHIRSNLDFLRTTWIEEIKNSVLNYEATIVKGVSGQGKSALCYRYLLEMYPEEFVFCIRSIISEGQAQNLASALIALSKYLDDFIIYIDVQPGENRWAYLLQELQMRGIKIPILISIRDEDYNITSFNGKAVQYNVIELELTEGEAHWIYDFYTENQPHATFRTFEDAWNVYGGKGPLIEFVYLLTNNQTLTQRIEQQIDAMMLERISDSWLELLHLVCFTGSLGCSVDFNAVKGVLKCDSMNAAVKRFSDEYLLRITTDGNRLEALHPVRANIIYNVLRTKTVINIKEALMKALNCVESKYVSIILMEYFTNYEYSLDDIQMIAKNDYKDWIVFGKVIKAILWLEVKQYVESNIHCFRKLNEEKGKGWLCFIPLDPTGIDRSNEIIAERMLEHMPGNKESIIATIHEVRETLSSLSLEYKLFCAARDISKLQQEYNALFLPYSTLDKNFCQQEAENLLTMVNVWRIVLDSVPRGQAIAYNAKQTFRKGVLYPDDIKEKIATFIDGTVYETKEKIYVLSKCEMTEEDSLEEAYAQFVLRLREIYKEAIEFSSNRWHMEMKEKPIVYIPVLFNAVNMIGFEVPLYKILDTEKSLISKPMIPCELEEEFKDTIFKNSMANENWCSTIAKVSTLKTYLQRYKQVISVDICEKCVDGIESFKDSFYRDLLILLHEIVESEDLIEYVVGRVSGDLQEAANALKDFWEYVKEFSEKIFNEEAVYEILSVIDMVVGVMMMIHKYVLDSNE